MTAASIVLVTIGCVVGVAVILGVALALSAHDADLQHPTPPRSQPPSDPLHEIRGEGSRMRLLPPEPEEENE